MRRRILLIAVWMWWGLAAAAAVAAQPVAGQPVAVVWSQMWKLHAATCEQHYQEVTPTIPGARRQRWVEHSLRAADYDAHTHVPAALALRASGKRAEATASIVVTYNGFPPAAQTAFQFAADIWETHIASDVPINIRAAWRALDDGILGSAGATFIDANEGYLPVQNTWYPIALAEALAGRNLTGADADISASFNSDFSNWYYGTDGNTPTGQYDLATVVLHEIGHGLGFFDGFSYDDGDDTNGDECAGGTGIGCAGIRASNGQSLPVIFDRFLRDREGRLLLNSAVYPSPSLALGTALLNPVRFDGQTLRLASGDIPVDLYAPTNFERGSSIAHLDESSFPTGDKNSLMTPFLARAESIFSPGSFTCAIFRDIGWVLGPDCDLLLGAEVLDFAVINVQGDDASLTFRTGPNAEATRVEIVQQYFDDPARVIESIDTDPGQTYTVMLTDLPAGRYVFSLRVTLPGGAIITGPEVALSVALRDLFALTTLRPNPFADRATATLLVRSRQDVSARLYDTMGRLVAILYSGSLASNTRLVLDIDGGNLPAGLYLLRVEGDGFAETRQLVHVE